MDWISPSHKVYLKGFQAQWPWRDSGGPSLSIILATLRWSLVRSVPSGGCVSCPWFWTTLKNQSTYSMTSILLGATPISSIDFFSQICSCVRVRWTPLSKIQKVAVKRRPFLLPTKFQLAFAELVWSIGPPCKIASFLDSWDKKKTWLELFFFFPQDHKQWRHEIWRSVIDEQCDGFGQMKKISLERLMSILHKLMCVTHSWHFLFYHCCMFTYIRMKL